VLSHHIPVQVVAEMQERFGTGSHFTQAYLEYWYRAPDRGRNNLDEILALPQPLPMWFNYALSANSRGEAYNIGEYYPLAYYRRALARNGCRTVVLQNLMFCYRQLSDTRPLLREAFESFLEYSSLTAKLLPQKVHHKIELASGSYFSRVAQDLGRASQSPQQQAFIRKYLTSFWTLLAIKED